MNIGPESKKLYKVPKIGELILRNHINLVQDRESDISPPAFENADVDLAYCDLPPSDKGQLMELIHEFHDLFASQNCKLGCTSIVKHEITTEGHPIRQVKRISVALKEVVDTEVDKILRLRVVRPSWSPWSSPTLMVR